MEPSLRGGPLDLWRCRCGFFRMPASVCCSVSHARYAAEAGFLGFPSAVGNAILSVWIRSIPVNRRSRPTDQVFDDSLRGRPLIRARRLVAVRPLDVGLLADNSSHALGGSRFAVLSFDDGRRSILMHVQGFGPQPGPSESFSGFPLDDCRPQGSRRSARGIGSREACKGADGFRYGASQDPCGLGGIHPTLVRCCRTQGEEEGGFRSASTIILY